MAKIWCGDGKGLGVLVFGDYFLQHFRSDFFVQEVVDHHVGAKAAVGQAFHSLHAPQAVRADSNGVVVVDAVFVNAQTRADGVEQAVRSRHGAGKSAAYADVVFSGAHLAQTGIESHHAQNMGGGDIQFLTHPGDGVSADEAELFLDFMQDGQHGGFLFALTRLRRSLLTNLRSLNNRESAEDDFHPGKPDGIYMLSSTTFSTYWKKMLPSSPLIP